MPAITKSFSFDPEQCPDVVRWFDGIPEYRGALSESIIRAIRADIASQAGVVEVGDQGEVMIILRRIERLLTEGRGQAEPEKGDLPDDVVRTLDILGGLEG